MATESAGILLYKRKDRELLVLLVHPGGPFWRNKDDGAWTIPKGERDIDEDAAIGKCVGHAVSVSCGSECGQGRLRSPAQPGT